MSCYQKALISIFSWSGWSCFSRLEIVLTQVLDQGTLQIRQVVLQLKLEY